MNDNYKRKIATLSLAMTLLQNRHCDEPESAKKQSADKCKT